MGVPTKMEFYAIETVFVILLRLNLVLTFIVAIACTENLQSLHIKVEVENCFYIL